MMKMDVVEKRERLMSDKEAIARPFVRAARMERHPANVLIVDDDVDSALLVESVFARLGCRTVCSLDPDEARKRICSLKADVIILDWILNDATDAKWVTDQCAKVFSKFGIQVGPRNKPKIVTYSSLDMSQIDVLKGPYFDHLDHWQKPIAPKDLLKRSLYLLEKIGA